MNSAKIAAMIFWACYSGKCAGGKPKESANAQLKVLITWNIRWKNTARKNRRMLVEKEKRVNINKERKSKVKRRGRKKGTKEGEEAEERRYKKNRKRGKRRRKKIRKVNGDREKKKKWRERKE